MCLCFPLAVPPGNLLAFCTPSKEKTPAQGGPCPQHWLSPGGELTCNFGWLYWVLLPSAGELVEQVPEPGVPAGARSTLLPSFSIGDLGKAFLGFILDPGQSWGAQPASPSATSSGQLLVSNAVLALG